MLKPFSLLALTLSVCLVSSGPSLLLAQTSKPKPPAPKTAKPAAPAPKPAAKPAAVEAQVPFRVGETLAYDVSWSNTVSAGTAVLKVQEKRPSYNSVAYYIVAEAQPGSLLSRLYSLYYKADTLLDAYSLLPQRGSLFSKEGKRQRMKITEFNHPARRARFEMQTASKMTKDLTVPADSQDMLSAIYSLRAIPATTGDRVSMAVADSGRIYMTEFVIGRPETVKLSFGSVAALRVTPAVVDDAGKPVGRGSTLWLSNDERRIPLKLEAQLAVGRFVLELQKAP
jgi:hypothetical protein